MQMNHRRARLATALAMEITNTGGVANNVQGTFYRCATFFIDPNTL